MHVLYLPSWYPSSSSDLAGGFFRDQAIGLRDTGCTVGVIAASLQSMRSPRALLRWSPGISHEDDEGIPTYRARLLHWTPTLDELSAHRLRRAGWKMFRRYVASHGQPDVLHAQSLRYGGIVAALISQRTGIPFVVSEHSSDYERQILNERRLRLARQAAEAAAARYAVSAPFSRVLASSLTMDAATWGVMPNGVPKEFLEHDLQRNERSDFTFLHVSTLRDLKQVDLIVDAFATAFGDSPEIKLVIGGHGETLDSLIQQSIKLGIERQVTFVGRLSREELIVQLSQAAAFVLASKHETFGVVLIESLAMGRPVIATQCGGPSDVVSDANGILVPAGPPDETVDGLVQAMSRMRKNIESYDPNALRSDCRDRFGLDALAVRWLEIYEPLVGSSRGKKQSAQAKP